MSEITTLEQLAVEHPYYCSDNNYYSREQSFKWNNWSEFYNEWYDADVDMNLIFRWDIKNHDDENLQLGKYMEIFVIHQRKGIFAAHHIQLVFDYDVPQIVEYLKKHYETLKQLWNPLSL